MGILHKTKTYLVGPMQYQEGRAWREEFTKAMDVIGVDTMTPYDKPFVNSIKEDESTTEMFKTWMDLGRFDDVHRRFKEIRRFDLAMVDRSTFITCYINSKTPTFGTMEELVIATHKRKPVFIFVEGTRRNIPLWLLGMFKPSCFFDSMEDLIDSLYKLDSGEVKLDDKYWRLFVEDFR